MDYSCFFIASVILIALGYYIKGREEKRIKYKKAERYYQHAKLLLNSNNLVKGIEIISRTNEIFESVNAKHLLGLFYAKMNLNTEAEDAFSNAAWFATNKRNPLGTINYFNAALYFLKEKNGNLL